MAKLTLDDLCFENKRVLVRIDGNVPIYQGKVLDDTRLRLSLPTIKFLIKHHAKVILLTHLGRPKGADPALSLRPLQSILSKALGQEVAFCDETVGEKAKAAAMKLEPGQVLLLENTRFNLGETHPDKDPNFTDQLAALGELFVSDAFASAHRSHASVTGLAHRLPAAMGLLMQNEIRALACILSDIKRPFHAIIGGAKIKSKASILDALLKKVSTLFIGGGMAFTFLKALGYEIGGSIVDDSLLEKAKSLIDTCEKSSIPLFLPQDVVIAKELEDLDTFKIIDMKEGIPSDMMGVDIGPKTIAQWTENLAKANTIFWNGPLGVFEVAGAAKGTIDIALFLAHSKAKTLVGGGDSSAAINAAGIDTKKFDHISTGGGATLEYIEFENLPGIEALTDKS